MENLSEYLKFFSVDKLVTISPIVISAIALVVSIAVAYSNRKTLDVNIYKNLRVLGGGTFFFADNTSDPAAYDDGLLLTVEVVNPSQKDIAFFDMRAFDPDTNVNVNMLTRRTAGLQFRSHPLWMVANPENQENPKLTELIIPDANYGVFKANSFTRFGLIIFPVESAEQLGFSFKVAMRAGRIKDPFAVTSRKKFKFYGTMYDISSWKQSLPQPKHSESEPT